MKFQDFYPGQVIEVGSYLVSRQEILEFARQWDPQALHMDEEAAQNGLFDGLVASGIHTLGIAVRLMADNILKGSESLASPGVPSLKWPHPVRPGDRLSLRVDVNAARRSKSKPDWGIVDWRWRLFNQEQLNVLDLQPVNLFNLKSGHVPAVHL